MKYLLCLITSFFFLQAIAYTQTDLLNAQNNYQAARDNYDTSSKNLKNAEIELSNAQSKLIAAQKDLKVKQTNLAQAKQNKINSGKSFTAATTTITQVWTSLNPQTSWPK